MRDTSQPHGRRVSALRSCVQLYRPIGFHASLSFLEESAGPFGSDEMALLRALDALTESREAWKADVRAYAAARSLAKRHGRRSPRPEDRNPSHFPDHWYGAPRRAALHALEFWCRKRLPALLTPPDRVTEDLSTCVSASLRSGGPLSDEHRRMLAECTAELRRRRLEPDRWRDDQAAYLRFRDLVKVARFVQTAADTV
ncbi:hypothetical protein [Actinoallomurus liliacearum]|uniref:hypothetical protein n=1 Tax=Actinoallomurus liliacearum TaxID=1080073 RepID=UPI0031EFC07F